MAVSPLFRPIALAAGISSVAQAAIWALLALLGILATGDTLQPTVTGTTFGPSTFFQTVTKLMYFDDAGRIAMLFSCLPQGDILSTNAVLIILCLYLAVNIIWLVISAIQLNNIARKDMRYTRNILLVWSGITSAVVLLDFSVTICFARDYDTWLTTTNILNTYCVLAPLVPALLMSLAARGFVLWILNVAFLVYLSMAAVHLSSADIDKNRHRSSDMSSSISSLYHPPPLDSLPPESRSIVYQPSGGMQRSFIPPLNYDYGSGSATDAGPSSSANWRAPPVPEPQSSQPNKYPRGSSGPNTSDWGPRVLPHGGPGPNTSGWGPKEPQRGGPGPNTSDWGPREPKRGGPGPNTPDWGIQSPQVGDQPRGPWSYPPVRQPESRPPSSGPPRGSQAPYQSSIPEPDYDDGSHQQRSKYEPRPFNEQPQRSALKKEYGRPGRTAF